MYNSGAGKAAQGISSTSWPVIPASLAILLGQWERPTFAKQ